ALGVAEVQRLGARLIAQRLPLQMRRDREDLQTVGSHQLHPLLRVRLRSPVVVAATQVQFPARLLPAIEARVGHELQPFALVHVAELASHQADLMKRPLAVAVFRRLLEPHVCFLSSERSQGEIATRADYTVPAADRKRPPRKSALPLAA